VHSETERQEALRLHGVPERQIRVVGIPHYDRYVDGSRTPRDNFCAPLGIPADRRIVLFAPTGDRYLAHNTVDRDIVEFLDATLPYDCHLLVRLPPTDSVASLDGFVSKRTTIERPSTRFGTLKNIELASGDDDHLADTLHWSDVVVSGPSTIAVDAAFFDKPVILIGFDGKDKRSYYDGVRRYYDYDHWQPVVESGGVRLVESEQALREALDAYVRDPKLDAEGRMRIVVAEAYQSDGNATERLAQVLLGMISQP
jgi:CDP-glycerol glycerophosphotransferase (TagB/SpsB family)